MKRLSFISFVLSAFLLIGFLACEPELINPEGPSVDSGGTSSDSTSVDNDSGGTSTDTTNLGNDAPNPEDFEYVDLGLSVKWATMNVGADSPEGYGDFYDYDRAVNKFGNNLPTKEQLQELEDKCTWEWTIRNEVNGWEVTGPNGKSIFLPAAGRRNCFGDVYGVGTDGNYWSSTPDGSDFACFLSFNSVVVYMNNFSHCTGHSVRLVQGNADNVKPDDDIEESGYVDLGLSVKWATMNVGADDPEDYGGIYDYDKAVSKFGNNLPTKEQFQELKNKCTWKWTTHKRTDGYKVTGPNGQSIFLPAAGRRNGFGDADGLGTYGYYWSSTPNDSDFAWILYFRSSVVYVDYSKRYYGQQVRLVQ